MGAIIGVAAAAGCAAIGYHNVGRVAAAGFIGNTAANIILAVALAKASTRLVDKTVEVVDAGSSFFFAGTAIAAIYWGVSSLVREDVAKNPEKKSDRLSNQILEVTDTVLIISSTGAGLYLLYKTISQI